MNITGHFKLDCWEIKSVSERGIFATASNKGAGSSLDGSDLGNIYSEVSPTVLSGVHFQIPKASLFRTKLRWTMGDTWKGKIYHKWQGREMLKNFLLLE